MDYKEFQNKILALQKERREYIRKEKRRVNYMNLFQISINILGKLFHLIKELKKS